MSRIFIKVEALPGTEVNKAIKESMELAEFLSITILLTFNGKPVYIDASDSFEEIYNRWNIKDR